MPNRAFGTLHDPLPRPDASVRVSFAHTRVSILGWIYDPDHSLPSGMYVDVPHLDCLLIAALITVERLDHIILKPQTPSDRALRMAAVQVLASRSAPGLMPPNRVPSVPK